MRWPHVLLLALVLCFGLFRAAEAQSTTPVMLKDGRSFFADSVEMLGDRVVVHVHGGGSIEVPFVNVACIGSACGQQSAFTPCTATPGKIGVRGSNTIGASLMPSLIEKYAQTLPGGKLERQLGAADKQTLRIVSGGAEKGVVDLQATGSGDAFKGLLDCSTQIGMSSRSINPQEANNLRGKYNVDMLNFDSEHVIGLDGVAVIVNSANPLKDVAFNLDVIARLFSGEVSDWGQIGGKPGPVKVIARDDKSGTFKTFDDLVLKSTKRALVGTAVRLENSDMLTDEVDKDANAIGFIGLPYIGNNKALSLGSSCGITQAASRFTIQSEIYPLSRRLFLYSIGTPADPLAKDLLTFALSDAAQDIVRNEKFVDQRVEFQEFAAQEAWATVVAGQFDRRVPKPFVDAFDSLRREAKRASVMFRFTKGSAQLDNKALLDVGRVARLLRDPSVAGKPWLLVGFADADGGFRANIGLAIQRATAVGDALRALGIAVGQNNISTLSSLAPVACNDNDQGKSLNRRVELWIQR